MDHHGHRPRIRWNVKVVAALAVCLPVLVAAPSARAQMDPVLAPYAERVDRAINRGLQFLLDHQQDNGRFPEQYGGSAGVVSLAGMAFLAAGHTPGRDLYGEAINRCLDYVLAQQRPDGYIHAHGTADGGMYTHHMSTLFLAEVSGMLDPAREVRVREALAKAVRVILTAQDVQKDERHDGGWRYSPRATDSDLSVSGWGLMALRSARLNGARVPDENIRRAVAYVKRNQDAASGGFGYQGPGGNMNLTGAAVMCLALTGHHESEELANGARFILNNYRRLSGGSRAMYGTYYTMQASFQVGGRVWREVGSWVYDTYLPMQREDGSWPGEDATTVYGTALILNAFAVPYRQLPVYQREEVVD